MQSTLLWTIRKVVATLLLLIGGCFCVVTFTPTVKWMVQATEPDWYGGNGEVLVVLGGSMLVPGTGPGATLGHDTYLRCVYAAWISQKQTFHRIVVTGDFGSGEQMAKFLIDR